MNGEPAQIQATFNEFAYSVSHDIGAVLRALASFAELLQKENPQGLCKESQLYLTMIVENGHKAQAMLERLTEYSRLMQAPLTLVTVDSGALLAQCQQELADKIAQQKALIHAGGLPQLNVDERQMKSLLMALLDNALTYHEPNITPFITVSAQASGDDWLFTVEDNGIGIDECFHEHIFKPFKRLHTESEYPGIGMGLALAKQAADRLGGKIWVSPSPKGARFSFTLPQARAHG